MPREPANGLLRPTMNWASTLPADARPNALLAKFPRIANLIAVLWQDPNSLRRYIDDLLVDKRGNRQGFPLDVLRELFALRAYYDEVNPRDFPAVGGDEQRRMSFGAAIRAHASGGLDRADPGATRGVIRYHRRP